MSDAPPGTRRSNRPTRARKQREDDSESTQNNSRQYKWKLLSNDPYCHPHARKLNGLTTLLFLTILVLSLSAIPVTAVPADPAAEFTNADRSATTTGHHTTADSTLTPFSHETNTLSIHLQLPWNMFGETPSSTVATKSTNAKPIHDSPTTGDSLSYPSQTSSPRTPTETTETSIDPENQSDPITEFGMASIVGLAILSALVALVTILAYTYRRVNSP